MCDYPINYVEIEHIYNQTIGAGYRTLAVTSAKQGEGKTSLVKVLAKRAKMSGKTVLVVELNTFNPALSEKIRDKLNQKSTTIIPMQEQGFNLLPAPQTIKDIMRFKETSILLEGIQNWLIDYDCLIFDTSALQSLNQSNIPPEIVCEVCEGALLIIQAGKTSTNAIEEAIKKLSHKKVNLIGSVINDKQNPTLLSEIIRETHRFDRLLPKAMTKFRKTLASIELLNVSV